MKRDKMRNNGGQNTTQKTNRLSNTNRIEKGVNSE